MCRDSGQGYNEKYADILSKRGAPNKLKVPEIKVVTGLSELQWPKQYLEKQWQHYIHGVRIFGLAHLTGVLIVTISAFLITFLVDSNQENISLAELLAPHAFAAIFLAFLLLVFSWFLPRLGRNLKSGSFLLVILLVVVWVYWVRSLIFLMPKPVYGFVLAGVYIIVWFSIYRRNFKPPERYGFNLLVLRVFGSWKRSLYLFEVFEPLWNQVGSVFSVASPDQPLIRPTVLNSTRINIFRIFWILLLLLQLFALLILEPSEMTSMRGIVLAVSLPFLACGLLYWLLRWAYLGSFMTRDSQVYTSLVKNVSLKLEDKKRRYKNIHIASYNDDWKVVVEAMSSLSDSVLIDLRGFSANNSGVVYELGFAVNNVRLENTLGLADDTTDFEYLSKVFADHWEHLSEDAWNYASGVTQFTIYKKVSGRLSDVFDLSAWIMSKSLRLDLMAVSLGLRKDEDGPIPVITWDRGIETDVWFLLTWLPEGHAGFEQCPHGGIIRWEQATDPNIIRPFTVRTQTLQPSEDEADFWKTMGEKVIAQIQSNELSGGEYK